MKEIKNRHTRSGKPSDSLVSDLKKAQRKQELLSRKKNPTGHLKIFLNGEELNLKGKPTNYATSGANANIEQALLKAGASNLKAETTIPLTPYHNPNPVIFSQQPTVVANNPPVSLPLTLSMPPSIVPPNAVSANSENNSDPAVEEVNNQLHTLQIKY